MAAKTIAIPSKHNENYNDDDKQHVASIIKWMNGSTSRTNRWLARCVGVSDASISTLLSGNHGTAAAPLIAKIIPVMEDSSREYQPGDFIETSTWLIVNHACKMARSEAGFSILAGSPGVGKTMGLEQYKKLNPNTLYLRGSEVINSTAVIDMLLEELGVKTGFKLRKSAKVKTINNLLRDTHRLIILDEADKCQKDTPDPLRTISDATGCGVVLAGNVNLRNLVAAGDNRYDLIESRVVFWPEVITKISPEDVKKLLAPYIKEELITQYESFDEVAKYAFELVDGSARKLIKSLVKHTLMVDRQSRENSPNYGGISRAMMAQIAQKFMGIAHPPAIPRRSSAV